MKLLFYAMMCLYVAENGRFVCAGWRLFKLPKDVKRGASRVTYKGNITGFPDALRWDVDLSFPVNLDRTLRCFLTNLGLNNISSYLLSLRYFKLKMLFFLVHRLNYMSTFFHFLDSCFLFFYSAAQFNRIP